MRIKSKTVKSCKCICMPLVSFKLINYLNYIHMHNSILASVVCLLLFTNYCYDWASDSGYIELEYNMVYASQNCFSNLLKSFFISNMTQKLHPNQTIWIVLFCNMNSISLRTFQFKFVFETPVLRSLSLSWYYLILPSDICYSAIYNILTFNNYSIRIYKIYKL